MTIATVDSFVFVLPFPVYIRSLTVLDTLTPVRIIAKRRGTVVVDTRGPSLTDLQTGDIAVAESHLDYLAVRLFES